MIQKETCPDFLCYGTSQNDIQRVQTINNDKIMIWLQNLLLSPAEIKTNIWFQESSGVTFDYFH